MRLTLKRLTPKILAEQFKIIGQEYTEDFVKQPEWYLKYTWTGKQEREFCKWLAVYLHVRLHMSMQRAEHTAAMWNLNYGWKQEGI